MSEKKQPRQRRTFTSEFKQQLVDLYRSGKRRGDIVREYDIASQCHLVNDIVLHGIQEQSM